MTFPFFFIVAHIYFNSLLLLPFFNVILYKTLNTRLDLYLLVINPPKPTQGHRCTFNKCVLRRRCLELMEQLMKHSGLSHTIGDGVILDLCTRARDDGLSLG
jgi:hypothetical protein